MRARMKEMILPDNLLTEKTKSEESAPRKSRKRWLNALFVASILGIVSGCAGLILSGLSLFGFLVNQPVINRLGTWLVVVAFPLMWFAAHCLDKADEAKKAIRREGCEREEMTGEDCR